MTRKRTRTRESTIENRVFLYSDLASAFLAGSGGALLASKSEEDRERGRAALAELAYAACSVADSGDLTPSEVRAALRRP